MFSERYRLRGESAAYVRKPFSVRGAPYFPALSISLKCRLFLPQVLDRHNHRNHDRAFLGALEEEARDRIGELVARRIKVRGAGIA